MQGKKKSSSALCGKRQENASQGACSLKLPCAHGSAVVFPLCELNFNSLPLLGKVCIGSQPVWASAPLVTAESTAPKEQWPSYIVKG